MLSHTTSLFWRCACEWTQALLECYLPPSAVLPRCWRLFILLVFSMKWFVGEYWEKRPSTGRYVPCIPCSIDKCHSMLIAMKQPWHKTSSAAGLVWSSGSSSLFLWGLREHLSGMGIVAICSNIYMSNSSDLLVLASHSCPLRTL